MNRIQSIFIFLIIVTALFLSSIQVVADEIDFGTTRDSVYRNEYLGLTVILPSDWSLQEQETLKALSEVGGRMIAGGDKNLEAAIKVSELTTLHLFAAFKLPIGSPVLFNPSIIGLAEKVAHLPGIKEGADYLFHTKRLLQVSQMEYIFPAEISAKSLGGVEFDVLNTELSVADITIRQEIHAAIIKGYALAIVISYVTDEEYSSLQHVLDTVTFD